MRVRNVVTNKPSHVLSYKPKNHFFFRPAVPAEVQLQAAGQAVQEGGEGAGGAAEEGEEPHTC